MPGRLSSVSLARTLQTHNTTSWSLGASRSDEPFSVDVPAPISFKPDTYVVCKQALIRSAVTGSSSFNRSLNPECCPSPNRFSSCGPAHRYPPGWLECHFERRQLPGLRLLKPARCNLRVWRSVMYAHCEQGTVLSFRYSSESEYSRTVYEKLHYKQYLYHNL